MAIAQRWSPGRVIGDRYRIDRFLAEGGSGEVYAAQNVWTGRPVAVKRLLPDRQADATLVERFLVEGRIGGRVEHPNIVDVLEMGREVDDGSMFIVQELLRGESLRSVIERRGQLAVREALDLIVPILGALVAVHQQGIVHRDVKPDNIFVLVSPFGQQIPKLLDFGIAKVSQEDTLTKAGSVMGTLGYMSPEQLASSEEVDRRADLWSMGIVMYELLSGAHPFEADTYVAAMFKIMHRQVPELHTFVPGCPRGLSDLIQKSLRKNRHERPDSALALLEELLRWSRQEPDEFLRTLVIRHRLSIPSSLEQRLLGADAAPLPVVRVAASGGSAQGPSSAGGRLRANDAPESADRESCSSRGRRGAIEAEPPSVHFGEEEMPSGLLESLGSSREAAGSVPGASGLISLVSDDDDDAPESVASPLQLKSYAHLAEEAYARNDFVEAFGVADIAVTTARGSRETQADMRLVQARASFWLGDASAQESYAEDALRLAAKGSRTSFLAAGELAFACSTLGNLDTLLALADTMAHSQAEGPALPDYLVACCRLGVALERVGWPEHVERVLGRVQEDLHTHGSTVAEVRAWTLRLRAELADRAGDHAHSLALTRDAARAFMEHGDERWACVCDGHAAREVILLGGYRLARADLPKAIERAASLNLAQASMMRLDFGLAEARDGDLPSAIERLQSGMANIGPASNWRQRSAGHRYLAEAFAASGRLDEAEQEVRSALALAEPSPALRAQALGLLADILLKTPRHIEAFMAASQAVEILVSVGVAEDEARIRLVYAMALDAMGHGRNAREAYDGARRRLLARADRISDPEWRRSFLEKVGDHVRTLSLAAERCLSSSQPPAES